MAGNDALNRASKAKKDEFYTQLPDIDAELQHYEAHFKNKTVLCNCDDPFESNFFKYFALRFNYLGIKQLIATCYDSSPVAGEQLSMFPERRPYMIRIREVKDMNGDGSTDLSDITEYLLRNKKNIARPLINGDFRSEECIELLEEADIVVTNPPFSLFREYVAQLIQYGKKFLIIGNVNAITYKEVFPLIKSNQLWLGYSIHSGDREFRVPDDYPLTAAGCRIDEKGQKYIRVKGVRWYTNMDYIERHADLDLWKKYTPEEYPQYDNYDAINVDKTADIPCDYFECMGVPITFLDKYNPEQFEIVNANDIRKNKVLIRPKPHGLIKDQEATITLPACSQNGNVERERERERERESTDNLCPNRHQTENITSLTFSQADTPASAANGSMLVSSLGAYALSVLMNEYGISTQDIDYHSGLMGVPITFLDKYNPEQFEIIGMDRYTVPPQFLVGGRVAINGHPKYARILIRRLPQ